MADPNRIPLWVAPDVGGPRVRLGVVWFAAAVGTALTSRPALAVVMAVAAAAGADELARIHLRERRVPAALMAAALPVGALGGARGLLGAAVLGCAVVAVSRLLAPGRNGAVAEVATALTGALCLGLAAASPVLVARFGAAAAVTMVVLVSAYEAGDYLVGSGASTPWQGPMAGMVSVAVCAFAAWVLEIQPLARDGVVAMALTIGLLAPLGPPAGTVLLGSIGQAGRYVRRLDTLLLVGPVAAWVVAGVLQPA